MTSTYLSVLGQTFPFPWRHLTQLISLRDFFFSCQVSTNSPWVPPGLCASWALNWIAWCTHCLLSTVPPCSSVRSKRTIFPSFPPYFVLSSDPICNNTSDPFILFWGRIFLSFSPLFFSFPSNGSPSENKDSYVGDRFNSQRKEMHLYQTLTGSIGNERIEGGRKEIPIAGPTTQY